VDMTDSAPPLAESCCRCGRIGAILALWPRRCPITNTNASIAVEALKNRLFSFDLRYFSANLRLVLLGPQVKA
jgi:hypothetical protein